MARSRNIKPSFFSNDVLAECDPLARLLFIGLWTIADKEGRLEYRPKRIKAEVLPYDNCDIDNLIAQLVQGGFVLVYSHGESQYIQVINFTKHQNPHMKEQPSALPAPDLHHTSTILARPLIDSLNPLTDSLLLNPLTGIQEEKKARAENSDDEFVYMSCGHPIKKGQQVINGNVIRLKSEDYCAWENRYHVLGDFDGILRERDKFLANLPTTDRRRKGWFVTTSVYLDSLLKKSGKPLDKQQAAPAGQS